MTSEPLLTARGLQKHYGSVIALANADVEIRQGEVLALLGQNGAGKSTLVNILSGHVHADAGELRLDGSPVTARELAGERSPVAVVQQELSVVPTMSVGENVFLANPDMGRWFSTRKAAKRAKPYLERSGLGDVDPMLSAGRLSIAEQQLVELARALARNARIVMLDEPTASLSDREIGRVLDVVRQLRSQGQSVVYISHRLDEVIEVADRAIVVRDGRSQPPMEGEDLKIDRIIEAMLGRPLEDLYPSGTRAAGDRELLRLDGVMAPGIDAPISFSLPAGEILGLAGQLGSAAVALIETLAAVRPLQAGTMTLDGAELRAAGPREAQRAGIAYCSGDRKGDGLFGVRSVQENLTAPALDRCTTAGVVSRKEERHMARELATAFGVDLRRLSSTVDGLSGGNQQKVALGKWAGIGPKLLLIHEPTRGVDVGARAEIYGYLRKLADDGMTIVFSSSDTDEVVGLADVVASFYRGRLVQWQRADRVDAATLAKDLSNPTEAAVAGGAR
jgi:ABC-type sugar transport system ATPase subunit